MEKGSKKWKLFCQNVSHRFTTHGHTIGHKNSKIYNVHKNMMGRCYNPNNPQYKNYGARGIKVCKRWHDFVNFLEDTRAIYREGLTIDREDNNGDYCKNNVRFVTQMVQMNNLRKNVWMRVDGNLVTAAQAARLLGIPRETVYSRLRRGVYQKCSH